MTQSEFDRMFEEMNERAKDDFLRSKHIRQVIVAFDGAGIAHVLDFNTDGRPAAAAVASLKPEFKKIGIRAYAHVGESVVREYTPGRTRVMEALVVSCVTKGHKRVRTHRIIRRPDPIPPDLVFYKDLVPKGDDPILSLLD